jgi:hypothetical protein
LILSTPLMHSCFHYIRHLGLRTLLTKACTSYTTPTIGISCRSMLPLIYSSAQTVLVILWLLDWNFWKRGRRGKLLNTQQLQKQRRRMSLADFAWYFWFLLSGAAAILTAVGGTRKFMCPGRLQGPSLILHFQFFNSLDCTGTVYATSR